MVTQGEDGRYYKPCAQCGVIQSYLRKCYAEQSLRHKRVCRPCSNSNPDNCVHKGYYKGILRKSFAHKYKAGAETRSINWDVSFEYLADLLILQDFKCALTGYSLDAKGRANNASLDRIDSSQGYIEGNLQWVTSKVNMMKQHYTQSEFIEICCAVAKQGNTYDE